MFKTFKKLWKKNRWLLLATGFAALITLFFAVRMVVFTIYWSDPAHRDQTLADWMTPRYVAKSWQVPREVVARALGLPQDGAGRRITLKEIASKQHIDFDQLSDKLNAAIKAHRAGK